ncbi:MAG TPA: undecaprenyl-diphosphate phosphatase [Roseiflexaceae bacterium]|nr:undecaprenyl-diphosphate phosphatase [Roseiflexaceae bacterium]
MQKTSPAATSVTTTRARPGFTIFIVLTLVGCTILALAGYMRAVVMGIVQGLGEFLPISSSAHLILVPWFFGWQGDPVIDSLTFDVALHLGTLVALLGYFWRDWLEMLRSLPGLLRWLSAAARGDRSQKLAPAEYILVTIVIATIPAAVIGILLENLAERSLRSPLLIALTLAIVGTLLYLADRLRPQIKDLAQMSWADGLSIGLAQACALIPGVSRSGATMTMGRFLTFDRESVARYSFLLSAPITGAAVLFKLPDILTIPAGERDVFFVGVLVSAAVGALAIGGLLAYILRAGFGIFAIYRFALALMIVLVYLIRI